MMSLDVVNMCPSVQVKLIKKALQHYSHGLPEEDKQRINLGLTMVKFGMKNMLVNFRDKFYIYQGAAKGQDLSEEDIVLAIGTFDSAFLADLVASFVLKKQRISKLRSTSWQAAITCISQLSFGDLSRRKHKQ
eukprot:15358866-Ditylum_brightwellii.AAC.1